MRKSIFLVLLCIVPALLRADGGKASDGLTQEQLHAEVHKSPSCGCCGLWAEHMQDHGFSVSEVFNDDMVAVKERYEIPTRLQSCHTAKIDGYIVEGHVPAADIIRLLQERPANAKGLTVPGMPLGSPGMEHPRPQSYRTFLILEDGSLKVFAEHPADGGSTATADHAHDQ